MTLMTMKKKTMDTPPAASASTESAHAPAMAVLPRGCEGLEP
jgi:hypothetical protein